MKQAILTLVFFLILSAVAYCDLQKICYFQTDSRYSYHIELLDLALRNTIDEYGPFIIKPAKNEMTFSRGLFSLETKQGINIGFFASSKERETRFLSIRVPLLRGLLGYRVALVRKDNIEKFAAVKSLEQLTRQFTAGFGSQWADMEILKKNSIPVMGTAKYENLFKMLSAGRFDYFPRGINEAWKEIEVKKAEYPNLAVEKYFAFYYPYPVYFFVNKTDIRLAQRIEAGLKYALKNGTLKALFLSHYGTIINQTRLSERKIFTLKNHILKEGTPEPDTSWWPEK